MLEDEQIEEMAKDLIEIFDEEYEKRRLITPQNIAEKMTTKGYRKATDAALEAVDDFQRKLRHIFTDMCEANDYPLLHIRRIDSAIETLLDSFVAELKKKYICEDTE